MLIRAPGLLTLMVAGFLLAGRTSAGELADGVQGRDEPPSAARDLFREHCAKCHGPDGKATDTRTKFPGIPDFTRPEWHKQLSDAQLAASILNGKGTAMPAFAGKISEGQARQLATCVRTFGGRAGAAERPAEDFDKRISELQEQLRQLQKQSQVTHKPGPQPPAAPGQSPRAPAAAPAVGGPFAQHCAKCHGADGTGKAARQKRPEIPNFMDARWQQGRSDEQLLASIRSGKGADMPAFGDKISEESARELVAEVRKFGAAPQDKPAEESRPPHDSSEAQQDELAPAADEDEALPERSFFARLIAWLGKSHPAAVHFPIGLLLGAAAAELLLLLTGRPLFEAASRVCVWFGAVAAVLAATLGWFLAGARLSDPSWVMTTHRWLGTSTVVCAGFVLLLSEISRRSDRLARVGFRLALLLVAILLLATGFFGGALIHSLDYYAWSP